GSGNDCARLIFYGSCDASLIHLREYRHSQSENDHKRRDVSSPFSQSQGLLQLNVVLGFSPTKGVFRKIGSRKQLFVVRAGIQWFMYKLLKNCYGKNEASQR